MKNRTKGFLFSTYLQIASLSLFFLFFLMLLSFNRIPPPNNTFDYKSTFPIILDTLKAAPSFRVRDFISTTDYDILYLGYEKDSIFLQHSASSYSKNIRYYEAYDKYKIYYKAKVQQEIDCSQEIKSDAGLEMDEIVSFAEDSFFTKTPYYKAYPVIIKNQEKKSIIIGHTGSGGELPLTLEAKNQAGEWKAIEEPFISLCGFGIHPIILRPQEIVVTGVKIYQGTFKTILRLKYGDIYSRTFQGSINPSQFNDFFNKNNSEAYFQSKK